MCAVLFHCHLPLQYFMILFVQLASVVIKVSVVIAISSPLSLDLFFFACVCSSLIFAHRKRTQLPRLYS